MFKNQSEICFLNYLWQAQRTQSYLLKNQSAIFFLKISRELQKEFKTYGLQ